MLCIRGQINNIFFSYSINWCGVWRILIYSNRTAAVHVVYFFFRIPIFKCYGAIVPLCWRLTLLTLIFVVVKPHRNLRRVFLLIDWYSLTRRPTTPYEKHCKSYQTHSSIFQQSLPGVVWKRLNWMHLIGSLRDKWNQN